MNGKKLGRVIARKRGSQFYSINYFSFLGLDTALIGLFTLPDDVLVVFGFHIYAKEDIRHFLNSSKGGIYLLRLHHSPR